MTLSSCQPGLSRSSCLTKYLMKVTITSAVVVACVSEHQILPSVSSAAISEILGATCLSVNVAGAPEGRQTRLMKKERIKSY